MAKIVWDDTWTLPMSIAWKLIYVVDFLEENHKALDVL